MAMHFLNDCFCNCIISNERFQSNQMEKSEKKDIICAGQSEFDYTLHHKNMKS